MFLPDLGGRNQFGDPEPTTPEKVLAKTNSFLQLLNQAGADIKTVIPVQVDMGKRGGIVGTVKETKQLLIIKK